MNFYILIILGYIIGWFTPALLKANTNKVYLFDIFLGILGSLSGGLIAKNFVFAGIAEFNLLGMIASSFCAVIFIKLSRRFTKV